MMDIQKRIDKLQKEIKTIENRLKWSFTEDSRQVLLKDKQRREERIKLLKERLLDK